MKKSPDRKSIVFAVCDELRTAGTDPTYTNVLPLLKRRGHGMSGRDLQPLLTMYSMRQKHGAEVRRVTRMMLAMTQRERRAVIQAVKFEAACER